MGAHTSRPDRLRILQILDSVEAEASGPSYSVPRLCDALAAAGSDVTLLTIGQSASERAGWAHHVFSHDYSRLPLLKTMRFSRGLACAAEERAASADVVHSHALWRMPSVYAAQAALRTSTPFVLSPRGMLGGAALRFSSSEKRLFWMLLQGRAAKGAACLHATSEQEYEDIRAFGLKGPVAIVPNGIDVPSQLFRETSQPRDRTILFLGRIHPKKGVRDLVEAWSALADRYPGWRLEIVGPTEGSYVAEIRRALDDIPRARLAGPLYGASKTTAYRLADLFVLPTMNENFGMTVAEALAQGTPVICSKGAPWRGLQVHGCGWWVDQGPKALIAALDEAMRLDRGALSRMGEAGWRWMASDFRWESVASRLTAVYRWLTVGEPRPEYVLVD